MSAPPPFVHLHCHSHYSLLDGAGRIRDLLERAQALRMNALALTDHGNLYGALKFYQQAKELSLNPILGLEAYVAPGSRFQKEASGMKEASYHLTLLAKNRAGFKNLIKLSSAAFLEGFYFRPRIDKELLEAHNEGLICLSGCISSELNRLILSGNESNLERARQVIAWFQKVFGDRYYIEIQNNGMEAQRVALAVAVELARQMGVPAVATSDVHYVRREDAEAQDILLCVNTGKFRTDANRMRMETNEFYLRSPEEMYAAFPGREEAVRRSQDIADSVDIELELGRRHFPVYNPPEGKKSEDYLRELCLAGLKERYAHGEDRLKDGALSDDVTARLERELGVINKLGFANYFLIVWDFVRFARSKNIPATARGSGVGSLVSYALRLSHVCPLDFDLLFERFLDESRREAPDIDIDFCQQRRNEVIQYVKDKYGVANVAQIGTFGTLQARAAIRDVGRALGMPIPRVDAVVALVPDELNITLEKALEKSEGLRKINDGDSQVRELLHLARQIEGLARNVGTHAAAVVIADRPLTEYTPVQHVQNKEEVITQWAMGDVERAGLLKMDFLGLRNLTILSKVVELIHQTTGRLVDPYQFPLDDEETFALLCRGETKGIFQLESGGIRDLLQRMKPDCFQDIIATNALYRPGPLEGGMIEDYIQVKHGHKKAEYKHPVMKEVLEETHGVMVYQEQVMRIINRLGGIELANAYSCIKAISKKKLEAIAKYREQFIDGAHAKGLSKKEAAELFGMIEKFAGYGFNKSHSTAYALIAYMTAYLKAHWPVEFMAALLSSDIPGRNFKKKDSLVEHLEDCQRMDIAVLPPDVNASLVDFSVEEADMLPSPIGRGVGGEGADKSTLSGTVPIFSSEKMGLSPSAQEENDPQAERQAQAQLQKIRFGLSAIKGCGGAASSAIVQERKARGQFRSIFDFCERLDPGAVNRTAIESLVKAGAFDSTVETVSTGQGTVPIFSSEKMTTPGTVPIFSSEKMGLSPSAPGTHRSRLFAAVDRALQSGASAAADRRSGQRGLFEDADQPAETDATLLPELPEWIEKDKLAREKEVLGFYLTSHPLSEHIGTLSAYRSHTTEAAAKLGHRTEVMLGGMLSAIAVKHSKRSDPGRPTRYAMFDLEDAEGLIRCICWPEQFAVYEDSIKPDAIAVVRGAVDKRPGSDEANLIVNEIIPLADLSNRFTRGVLIRVDESHHGPQKLQQLYEILRGYPGKAELQLDIHLADGRKVPCQCSDLSLTINAEMRTRVDELLGQGNFRLITAAPTVGAKNGNGWGRR
jgi:DNA polymerase-3 subunit alpha